MRTVDPTLWSKHTKGRRMALAWPLRFGRRGGREARLRASLADAAGEFWRNCSVEGVRRIVSEDTPQCERYRWILLLTASLLAGSVTLSLTMKGIVMEPPLLITLQSTQHSIDELPFPAVALCSVNVISRQALIESTSLILQRDLNHTYSAEAIHRNLLDSGALLTLALPKVDLQFAHYLQGLQLNITALMLLLAPKCDSLLKKCSWAGKEKPCDSLFATRITSVGVCCVFNGRYEDEDHLTPPKMLDRVGQDNGLSVAIREDSDDFAYIRKPSTGLEVLIFDGSQYPFLEGGSVRAQLAPVNTSVYYTIRTRAQFAAPNLDQLNEAWVIPQRGCRLPRSGTAHIPRWRRSYSWCLLECRRYAALQLCGCVPYTLQPRKEHVCTLNELSCLNKHREKFLYYHPTGYSLDQPGGEALSEELQDALFCPRCVADCARPVFIVDTSYAAYQNRLGSLFQNKFVSGLSLGNTSWLRFFYSTEDQYLFAVMCSSDWYETLAYVSSQWVTLLGISLVTVFELVFHCTVRWRHHYLRRRALLKNAARSDIY